MSLLVLLGIALFVCLGVDSSHFRGGTISWKATGNGNEVTFSFKLGWAYNNGPGCTSSKIGQFVTNMNTSYWQCTSGCNSVVNIANVNYICTGASQSENWEQGEGTFTYEFPGIGPYRVEFKGGAWVQLSYGTAGSWSISTVVYLAKRNDTRQPNTSPLTTGKPVYRVQYGCQNEILLPVVDDDGDDVKCRWSNGSECGSICNALPGARIDSNTCTIRFHSSHTSNGTFAVAVTVQDFPKSNIAIAGQVYLSSMPISTVVLQFLVKTPPLTVSCNDKPSFVSPTQRHGSVIHTDILQVVNISFYASGSREIIGIDVTTPAGMTYTPLQSDSSRIGTKFLKATWTPQQHQVGSHITCALAEDVIGKTSDSRCIKIIVRDVSPCVSSPCGNRGTCVRQAITQNYVCTCRQGYTGNICQTDINDCASGPCQNNGTCQDHVNGFTCLCVIGFTGRYCETDTDECASNPCQNNGTCLDAVNQFSCVCVSGFTDQRCQKDIDECASHPCQHHGTCIDGINQFTCSCPSGFTGVLCQTDECAISPCKNSGTCVDQINAYRCICVAGYTGNHCQTDINECDNEPCSSLYDCQDLSNQYSCELNVGKLMAVLITVTLIASGSVFLVYKLKGRYKDVVSWLSKNLNISKLDWRSKNVIKPNAPQKEA